MDFIKCLKNKTIRVLSALKDFSPRKKCNLCSPLFFVDLWYIEVTSDIFCWSLSQILARLNQFYACSLLVVQGSTISKSYACGSNRHRWTLSQKDALESAWHLRAPAFLPFCLFFFGARPIQETMNWNYLPVLHQFQPGSIWEVSFKQSKSREVLYYMAGVPLFVGPVLHR